MDGVNYFLMFKRNFINYTMTGRSRVRNTNSISSRRTW